MPRIPSSSDFEILILTPQEFAARKAFPARLLLVSDGESPRYLLLPARAAIPQRIRQRDQTRWISPAHYLCPILGSGIRLKGSAVPMRADRVVLEICYPGKERRIPLERQAAYLLRLNQMVGDVFMVAFLSRADQAGQIVHFFEAVSDRQ